MSAFPFISINIKGNALLRKPIRDHKRQSLGLNGRESRPRILGWGSWGLHEILLYSTM